MHERQRFEALLAVLEELAEENARTPIIVEGQRDVASLRDIGCRGEILVLHAGVPLMELAERIARHSREVILLTDWDRKGCILYEQFSTSLAVNAVRLRGQYWDRIAQWSAPSLQDVESLATYVARHLSRHLREDLHERVARMEG